MSFKFEYCKPPDRKLAQHAASLFSRRHEAMIVARNTIDIPGWQPLKNHCHANTLMVESYGSGYTAVHGWLYLDFDRTRSYVRFVAHSVIKNTAHDLIDITPVWDETANHPFIAANVDNAEYEAMLNALLKKYGASDCLDYWL